MITSNKNLSMNTTVYEVSSVCFVLSHTCENMDKMKLKPETFQVTQVIFDPFNWLCPQLTCCLLLRSSAETVLASVHQFPHRWTLSPVCSVHLTCESLWWGRRNESSVWDDVWVLQANKKQYGPLRRTDCSPEITQAVTCWGTFINSLRTSCLCVNCRQHWRNGLVTLVFLPGNEPVSSCF